MRDFSYKMQQIRDFNCKNQGREPGPKKKMTKKCQLNSAPDDKSSCVRSAALLSCGDDIYLFLQKIDFCNTTTTVAV